jgi:HAMP domain-containing protein
MKKKYRRTKKLIKPRLQLKLALFGVLFLYIITLVFGISVFFPLAMELYSSENLEDQGRIAMVVLELHDKIWVPLSMISFLIFVGIILYSHRIAGPIYRLEKTVEQFIAGNFKERMRLRKKDELKEIEPIINNLAQYLETVKSLDASFHEKIKEKLIILRSTFQPEGPIKVKEASNIVDELIHWLEIQPDVFSAIQN